MVECVLKIKNKSNEDFTACYGGRGEILIPVIELDTSVENDPEEIMEFEIEVIIRKENGWPISQEEISEINLIKQNMYHTPQILINEAKRNQSKQKTARRVSATDGYKNESIERNAPFWKLQLLTDLDATGHVSLEVDTRELENILEMKSSWEEADPGRKERAEKIREQYLLNCGESTKSEISFILKEKQLYKQEDFRNISIFSHYFSNRLNPDNYFVLDDYLKYRELEHKREMDEHNEITTIFIEKRKSFQEEQSKKWEAFMKNSANERILSADIMSSSHEMREEYIKKQQALLELKEKEAVQKKKELKSERNKEKAGDGAKGIKKKR